MGRDLEGQWAGDDGARFECNRDVQLGVFLANHLHLTALEQAGVEASHSLGLSLGEYNHCVHIGALGFEDALRLVDARGAAYDQGPEGMMASVFPLELAPLTELLDEARAHGELYVSNYNSPTQHVIAGERQAVEWAVTRLEDEGVHAVVIERRIPMHTPRFAPVAERLLPHLAAAPWRKPHRAYFPNVLGRPLPEPTPEDFVRCLAEHVHQPVRWRESIEHLAAAYPSAAFIEVGPRRVLTNLLGRRWVQVRKYSTDAESGGAAEHFRAVVEEVRRAA